MNCILATRVNWKRWRLFDDQQVVGVVDNSNWQVTNLEKEEIDKLGGKINDNNIFEEKIAEKIIFFFLTFLFFFIFGEFP